MNVVRHQSVCAALCLVLGGSFGSAQAELESSSAEVRTLLQQVVSETASGNPPLSCSVAAAWKSNPVEVQQLYESGQWEQLARQILATKFGDNAYWFMLGRAAEGLGEFEAADFLYSRAQASSRKQRKLDDGSSTCRCFGFTCLTKEELLPLIEARRANTSYALATSSEWTRFEREIYLATDLMQHVAFHQCHRWAKGTSEDVIYKWVAAIAAGTLAGAASAEIVGGISRTEMVGYGVSYAVSAQAVADVYTAIRFPNRKTVKGGFSSLFPLCLKENGLTSDGDQRLQKSWRLSDVKKSELAGIAGSITFNVSLAAQGCHLDANYSNEESRVVTPVFRATVLSQDSDSLETLELVFPSLFPGKSFSKSVRIDPVNCDQLHRIYISSAVDGSTGKGIVRFLGSEFPLR